MFCTIAIFTLCAFIFVPPGKWGVLWTCAHKVEIKIYSVSQHPLGFDNKRRFFLPYIGAWYEHCKVKHFVVIPC